jgi:crossover junction endodeoxyribonuclease RuvC
MKDKIRIGIDPGLQGAIAFFRNGYFSVVYDTPVVAIKVRNKSRREYLTADMVRILRTFVPANHDIHVFLEAGHSRPGEGVSSAFSLGRGIGIWIGILSALELPFTLIAPVAWKRFVGFGSKDNSRIRVQQLFPHIDIGPKACGRSDAIMIAYYGIHVLMK